MHKAWTRKEVACEVRFRGSFDEWLAEEFGEEARFVAFLCEAGGRFEERRVRETIGRGRADFENGTLAAAFSTPKRIIGYEAEYLEACEKGEYGVVGFEPPTRNYDVGGPD